MYSGLYDAWQIWISRVINKSIKKIVWLTHRTKEGISYNILKLSISIMFVIRARLKIKREKNPLDIREKYGMINVKSWTMILYTKTSK
jgi:hypothetical protein